jgi:FMN reductase
VSGSPNTSSRPNGIIQHIERQLIEKGVCAGHLAVTSLPAKDLIFGRYESPEIIQANALVESADAVIFASPVYKASYTGVLKTYLDLLPQKGLAGKIVFPVFIGGSIAHLLAIDFSFKPVASALGARHFAAGVYAVDTYHLKISNNNKNE